MSYYDDLGVARSASPEEIREAYRTLARLFHPDQHTDPTLKQAAEGQMRRLNAIYSVLSDPEQRRRYDMGPVLPVREKTAISVIHAPRPYAPRRLDAGSLIWIGVAAFSLGAIFWLATLGQPKPARPPEVSAAPASKRVPERAPAVLPERRVVRQPEAPAPTVAAETPAMPEIAPAPPPALPPVTHPAVEPIRTNMPEPAAMVVPAAKAPVKAAAKGFGGFWAYLHDQDFRQAGKYPPLFIETSIVEKDGRIHGKYKARYYVSDRPISPNVNFEFDGEISGSAAKLVWHGEGGSQGQVEMTLVSDDQMEVVWRASDLGQTLGLASGRAILRRRPE